MLSQTTPTLQPLPSNTAAIAWLCQTFSYRWNFIYKTADSGHWVTESAFPLSDADLWAFWESLDVTIGVRFGPFTRYGLIDIDTESPYHPKRDPGALARIRATLESIGICRTILIQSSDSEGLHLYIPLNREIKTYTLAKTLTETLIKSGFTIAPGTLEVFPHCKIYNPDRATSYNGHRLPLQENSYLLNDDFAITSDSLHDFISMFNVAAISNDALEVENAFASIKKREAKLKKKQKSVRLGQRGKAWKESLERVISQGWTAYGQTNAILCKIAQHGRVFLHLEGEALKRYCVTTALSCPGFKTYCRHQNEIESRCYSWAKSVQAFYTPYKSEKRPGNPWKGERKLSEENQQRSLSALERIKSAIAQLKESGTLATVKVRELLTRIARAAKCSLATLYKHKQLWVQFLGCNSHNDATEDVSDDAEKPPDKSDKSPEPSPDGLLHTKEDYEGVSSDFPLPALRNQAFLPLTDTRRASFSDRDLDLACEFSLESADCRDLRAEYRGNLSEYLE